MNFVWSVHEPLRADAGVPSRQWRIMAVAERAVELDRRVDNLMHHVG